MARLPSKVDTGSAEFVENAGVMQSLVDGLNSTLGDIHQGGGDKSRARHIERGKLLPRERIQALIDPGTDLLEFSALAAHGLYGGDVPAAG
ncbi:MAG: methylcrotonoyl-CoA carboxylase, partial [Rhodospirillaceae bacterium]|nr:methylcrotonoyl-CoA carboxylase [Rhodospirillaceae bacterium]